MPAGPQNPSNEDAGQRSWSQGDARFRPDASHAQESSEPERSAGDASDLRLTDIETLLRQAEDALSTIDSSEGELPMGAHPLDLQDFAAASPHGELDVVEPHRSGELELAVELGRVRLRIQDVLNLRRGAVVPLEPLVGAPVDVFAEGRLVAQGEVLVLDGRFCVRVTQVFSAGSSE